LEEQQWIRADPIKEDIKRIADRHAVLNLMVKAYIVESPGVVAKVWLMESRSVPVAPKNATNVKSGQTELIRSSRQQNHQGCFANRVQVNDLTKRCSQRI